MPEIRIVENAITLDFLKEVAKERFGDMIKVVVDCEKEIMAIGGELHSDEESALLQSGSVQSDLWGINLYPDIQGNDWLEFDSMINVRPSQGNRSRGVESIEIQNKIKSIVAKFITK